MQQVEVESKQNEVDVIDLLVVLARQKKIVIGLPVAAGLLAMLVSLQMTPIFSSTVKIMPPTQQQGSGMAAMLGQLGGLAGAAGMLSGAPKSQGELYVGLLESRTVADRLIVAFKLQARYQRNTMDETRKVLESVTRISVGKSNGFITVDVDDKDPQFAADLANAYATELDRLTQSMALSESSQRRLFFEKQLKDARDQLADSEVALRKTQEKTGMLAPELQVGSILGTVAGVKASIAAKEIQLGSMRTFATNQNPELVRVQEELRGLRAQLTKLEQGQPSNNGDFLVPTGKIPEFGVEFVRAARNVKYYETIFELLAKQFELAKIDEAKESNVVQVLDKAIPADRKSKPSRALITLVGAFVGGLLGIVIAFIRETYSASRRSPAAAQRWQKLAQAWRPPRST